VVFISIQLADEVLYFFVFTPLEDLFELTALEEPRAVAVKVVESFAEGLLDEQFLPTLHGDHELVEVDFSGLILVDGVQNGLNLLLAVVLEIVLVDRDEFTGLDEAVVVRVDFVEEVRQLLSLLLVDLLKREKTLHHRDQVIAALSRERLT
jgi:hypothetical protein